MIARTRIGWIVVGGFLAGGSAACGGTRLLGTTEDGSEDDGAGDGSAEYTAPVPPFLRGSCVGGECPLSAADATWQTETGLAGESVAIVGDTDGDGFDDIAIGAIGRGEGRAAGRVYLIYGRADLRGDAPLSRADAILTMPCYDCQFGKSVAVAGDTDGDGLDDFVVGVPGDALADYPTQGLAWVIVGSATRFSGTVDLLHEGRGQYRIVDARIVGGLGHSVAGPGDIDGDTLDDLVLGAPFRTVSDGTRPGAAYVVYSAVGRGGMTAYPVEDIGVVIEGTPDAGGITGLCRGRTDLDGDGFADVVLSVEGGAEGWTVGHVAILYGGTTRVAGSLAVSDLSASLIGADDEGGFGRPVAAAGDVDDDGRDDLLATSHRSGDESTSQGLMYLAYGRVASFGIDEPAGSLGALFEGPPGAVTAGGSIAGAGDVNGDGYDDFLVGNWDERWDGERVGAAYLFLGMDVRRTGTIPLASPDVVFVGVDDGEGDGGAGWLLAGGGDVNGDGLDDMVIGDTAGCGGDTCPGTRFYLVLGARGG